MVLAETTTTIQVLGGGKALYHDRGSHAQALGVGICLERATPQERKVIAILATIDYYIKMCVRVTHFLSHF